RILLGPRQRILAQAVHRTTAVASIVFLLVHIGIKIGQDHVSWIAAVIPFGLALTDDEAVMGRSFLIGLGTLAGFLMIFVGITGILRNRFATPAPVAARWRAMHMLAYPAWCAALVHGLYAGRAAKPVFLILYGLSVLGVMTALVLRASPRPVKRKIADRLSGLVAGLDQQSGRDRLEESRSRTAENALAGYENPREPRPRGATPAALSRASGPPPRLPDAAERRAPEPASGVAAAPAPPRTPPRLQRGARPLRAPARDRRTARAGTGERLRRRLPRGVGARRAPAALRRGPDRPHGTAAGPPAHGGRPARRRGLQ